MNQNDAMPEVLSSDKMTQARNKAESVFVNVCVCVCVCVCVYVWLCVWLCVYAPQSREIRCFLLS